MEWVKLKSLWSPCSTLSYIVKVDIEGAVGVVGTLVGAGIYVGHIGERPGDDACL